MKKFKNKYRSDSIRLQGYDYSSEGIYFITICTKNRVHYFGKAEEGKMMLSKAGKIVANEWVATKEKRDRVILGEWVVMPNHFHCLIFLKPKPDTCKDASSTSQDNQQNRGGCDPSVREIEQSQAYKNEFGPQSDNISSIIRGFKASCTRQIRESGIKNFEWLTRFYDHIVRDQESLLRIEDYIRENPSQWSKDKFNT